MLEPADQHPLAQARRARAARRGVHAHVTAVAEALQSGREHPAQLPLAVEEALIAARQRVPWTLIDRTYRIGHAVLWEQLLAEVESWRLDSSERLDLLRVISHFLFQYVDHVAGGLADVHQADATAVRGRERGASRGSARCSPTLPARTPEATTTSPASTSPPSPGARTASARSATSEATQAAVLIVPGQSGAAWGWLGAHSIAPSWPKLARELALPAETFLALGAPAAGAAGFRLSHREALEAAACSAAPARRWASRRRLAQALVLRDERAAQDFVARELGPLLDGGKRTQILLETLGAYVSSGWSAASTGARLGVHERTIGYRVATIEQRLGRPLAARREELGVALRLHAALGR